MALPASDPAPPLRIVVVDDHAAVGEMTARFAEGAGCAVAGLARDAASALEVCRRERPGAVVLDPALSVEGRAPSVEAGLALVPALRACCPQLRLLVFAGCLRPAWIRRLLLAGAHGLVEKRDAGEELARALRALAAGQVYYSRRTSEQIRALVARDAARRSDLASLSERERSVLRAVAEGLSSKEISARLGLSVHTVVNHRCRLMKKTGRRGAAQLARFALEWGLVEEAAPA